MRKFLTEEIADLLECPPTLYQLALYQAGRVKEIPDGRVQVVKALGIGIIAEQLKYEKPQNFSDPNDEQAYHKSIKIALVFIEHLQRCLHHKKIIVKDSSLNYERQSIMGDLPNRS
ncbi:UNKNOWN [Stylonychia lemnae]|uniref:Uncharacterized protein n=1 Tax=Stylonychia lemnae TaxID=5949 RepID=A0A077ZRQ7_STYLE|nr:UNKNOWN [Stylonychia lemnae]|eukprot:CDW72020.1 UNKNOWN [Stylonychia lemnae]